MPSEYFLYRIVLLFEWVLYHAEWVLPIQNSTIIWVSTILYRGVLLCEWLLSCPVSTFNTEFLLYASENCIMPSEYFLYRIVLLFEWVLYHAEWVLPIQNSTLMRVSTISILYRGVLLCEWVLSYAVSTFNTELYSLRVRTVSCRVSTSFTE